MDPDATLRELRESIERCVDAVAAGLNDNETAGWIDDALGALEDIQTLDAWISAGGSLPRDWRHKIPPRW